MNTNWKLCFVMSLLVLTPACKKKFGAGCEKATSLTTPWTGLQLPIDEAQTRVCESNPDSLKLRSYAWDTASEAQSTIASALGSGGWAKDRCGEKACYYDKDGYQVSVQPMDFKIRKKKLVTVMLRHRADPTQKKNKS